MVTSMFIHGTIFFFGNQNHSGGIVKEFKSCKRGAGIDTYEFEGPYIPKNFEGQEMTDSLFKALINHPKVIYTPHAAYYIDDAVKKTS
ncbi:D-lactate dehydrogenase [Streptococcus dysgalactiae subsp. dysgalactiae]|uniref:D-lactate dehydrogenase n=1 Tax=Streptococcus dysgalactiae subsp. dysgalactiae TaxID=99822 RepID=A0A380JUJ2_STRDY|nr:D-lactate dehydrogenase [Streptococcus dysgalactiae subsp. dysgalactiae]